MAYLHTWPQPLPFFRLGKVVKVGCEGWGVGHVRTYQGVLWFKIGTLPLGVRVHDSADLINI